MRPVLGKPAGIEAAAWLAVASGLAALPRSVIWPHLPGIGFTITLFISGLALEGDLRK